MDFASAGGLSFGLRERGWAVLWTPRARVGCPLDSASAGGRSSWTPLARVLSLDRHFERHHVREAWPVLDTRQLEAGQVHRSVPEREAHDHVARDLRLDAAAEECDRPPGRDVPLVPVSGEACAERGE